MCRILFKQTKTHTATYECDKVAKAGENRMLTELQEFSKNNTKINPKVIEDMTIVTEKIPCNTIIIPTLLLMVRISLYSFFIFDILQYESRVS